MDYLDKSIPIFYIAFQIFISELSWLPNRFLQVIPSVSNCSYFFSSLSHHYLGCIHMSTFQFVNHFCRAWSVIWNQYFRCAVINIEKWKMPFLDFDTIFLLIHFRIEFAFPRSYFWFMFIERSWWFSCVLLYNMYIFPILYLHFWFSPLSKYNYTVFCIYFCWNSSCWFWLNVLTFQDPPEFCYCPLSCNCYPTHPWVFCSFHHHNLNVSSKSFINMTPLNISLLA